MKEGKERFYESIVIENTRTTYPTEFTKQGSYGIKDTEEASTSLPGSVQGQLEIYYDLLLLLAWCFVGLLSL